MLSVSLLVRNIFIYFLIIILIPTYISAHTSVLDKGFDFVKYHTDKGITLKFVQNYKDDNGVWQPVDTRITPDYKNTKNRFKTYFDTNFSNPILNIIDDGTLIKLKFLNIKRDKKHFQVASINKRKLSNKIHYLNIYNYTTISYEISGNGIKEQIRINKKTKKNKWVFHVEVLNGSIKINGSELYIYNRKGNYTGKFTQPFVYDSTYNYTSLNVHYTFLNGSVILGTIKLSKKYLDKAIYPIIIDPTYDDFEGDSLNSSLWDVYEYKYNQYMSSEHNTSGGRLHIEIGAGGTGQGGEGKVAVTTTSQYGNFRELLPGINRINVSLPNYDDLLLGDNQGNFRYAYGYLSIANGGYSGGRVDLLTYHCPYYDGLHWRDDCRYYHNITLVFDKSQELVYVYNYSNQIDGSPFDISGLSEWKIRFEVDVGTAGDSGDGARADSYLDEITYEGENLSLQFWDNFSDNIGTEYDGVSWKGYNLSSIATNIPSEADCLCWDWCDSGNTDDVSDDSNWYNWENCYCKTYQKRLDCMNYSSFVNWMCINKSGCYEQPLNTSNPIDTTDKNGIFTCAHDIKEFRDCDNSSGLQGQYDWLGQNGKRYYVINPHQYDCEDCEGCYSSTTYDYEGDYLYGDDFSWHDIIANYSCPSNQYCSEYLDDEYGRRYTPGTIPHPCGWGDGHNCTFNYECASYLCLDDICTPQNVTLTSNITTNETRDDDNDIIVCSGHMVHLNASTSFTSSDYAPIKCACWDWESLGGICNSYDYTCCAMICPQLTYNYANWTVIDKRTSNTPEIVDVGLMVGSADGHFQSNYTFQYIEWTSSVVAKITPSPYDDDVNDNFIVIINKTIGFNPNTSFDVCNNSLVLACWDDDGDGYYDYYYTNYTDAQFGGGGESDSISDICPGINVDTDKLSGNWSVIHNITYNVSKIVDVKLLVSTLYGNRDTTVQTAKWVPRELFVHLTNEGESDGTKDWNNIKGNESYYSFSLSNSTIQNGTIDGVCYTITSIVINSSIGYCFNRSKDFYIQCDNLMSKYNTSCNYTSSSIPEQEIVYLNYSRHFDWGSFNNSYYYTSPLMINALIIDDFNYSNRTSKIINFDGICMDKQWDYDEVVVDYGNKCGACNDKVLSKFLNETDIDYGGRCGYCDNNSLYKSNDLFYSLIQPSIFMNTSRYVFNGLPININLTDECQEMQDEVLGGGAVTVIISLLLFLLLFFLGLAFFVILVYFLIQASPVIVQVVIILLKFLGRKVIKILKRKVIKVLKKKLK